MIAVRRPPLDNDELAKRVAVETDRVIAQAAARERVDFRPEVNRKFWPRLLDLFNEKCAYCESTFDTTAPFGIENFRPKSAVKEDPGFPGYYWLAYRWDNLLLACQDCYRSKANHFPIAGRRASSPADDLAAEQPLLLDPCTDNPADHLVFSEEGVCAGVTERGKVTVQILNLNRPGLVTARKGSALFVERTLQQIMMGAPKEQQQDRFRDLLSEQQPYTALRRQVAARVLDKLRASIENSMPGVEGTRAPTKEQQRKVREAMGRFSGISPVLMDTPRYSDAQVKKAEETVKAEEAKKRSFSIESSSSAERAFFQQGFKGIERVEIRNFKAIRSLQLEFGAERDRAGWLMLLGENASGKSSILKATALALIGEAHANSLALDKASLVNRHAAATGEACEVKVHLVGLGEIRLSFAADSERFSIDPPEPKMLLAGYGATRLLPSEAQRAASSAKYIRVMNLFDPVAPLNDVESWLVQQLDKTNPTHADFQESLRLLFPEVERIEIASGHVLVWIGGDRIPLHDLSDGFQSLIALLGDIAITVSDYWPSLRVAEGLVLLDEIETHLHPRWKIEIVERLRAACPQLTFLVTTHDPLCLKGLEDTEIAVLRRTPGTGVTVEVNSVSLTHLRWDQLLSSFLFNLPSSRSSAAPAMVARYSRLLGKPDKTPAEHEEMTRLRKDVTAQFSSALTPMQRSVENAVLRTLGDNDAAPPNREDVKLEVRRQVVDLLDTGEHTS